MWERRVPIVLRKLRIIKPDERLRSQLSERAQRIGSLIFRMHINQTINYHQSLLEQRQDDAYRFAVLFDDGIKGEVVYDELPLDEVQFQHMLRRIVLLVGVLLLLSEFF